MNANTTNTNVMAAGLAEGRPADSSSTIDLNRTVDHGPLLVPPLAAWELLQQAAADFPLRTAWHSFDDSATWAELWDTAQRMAHVLRNAGVQPGDRVGILLPNLPEFPAALNGIWLAGATAVILSPLSVTEEISALIERTNCRVVIALDMLATRILDGACRPDCLLLATLRPRLPRWQQLGYLIARRRQAGFWWLSDSDQIGWLDDALDCVEAPFTPVPTELVTATACILPTGGTTAAPKAVLLSHRNLVANALQQRRWAGERRGEDVFVAVLPFFHCYGLSASLLTGTAMAATLVMHPRFNAALVLRLIEQHRATVLHAVPAMLRALNERLRKHTADLSSLVWCISGGAPLPEDVSREFAEHTAARIVEGYGLSEASPVTHVGPATGANPAGSIGRPLPGTEAKIVDLETGLRELPAGETGELVIRGPQVMKGYLDNPEATARAVRNGWLHTNDVATVDADGFFRIVDRRHDLILTSGFSVFPADVEDTLRQHPDVDDAAVIGVPDEQRGEIVKAVLKLKRGATFDSSAMDAWCHEHLAAHRRPRLFEVASGDLPRNFLGKVLRRHLRTAHEDAMNASRTEEATGVPAAVDEQEPTAVSAEATAAGVTAASAVLAEDEPSGPEREQR